MAFIFKLHYRGIRYQTDKLAGCVGGTEMTRYHTRMQGRKCRSCKLWGKAAEKKNTNSNTLGNQHNDHAWALENHHCTQPRATQQHFSTNA
ncbi:hypothetical protein TNCV_802761 [Trichonephila clavipes]|nr:hypothetical protein TNCV_802761 [Trichonephila clavipes]